MGILTKNELNKRLYEFYVTNYGERSTDEWFDPPAANVWVFKRDNNYISLKAHILTGEVEVFTEQAPG